MIDKIYNYFIYRKLLRELHLLEMSIINSNEWYCNRSVYRECIDLEIALDNVYESSFNNLLIAKFFSRVDELQRIVKKA